MDDRERMEQKLRAFDEVMRKKYNITWDRLPRWTEEPEDGTGQAGAGGQTGPGGQAGNGTGGQAGNGQAERARAEPGAGSGTGGKTGRAQALPARAPEKRNPNRKENEFMLNLMILRNALFAHAPAIRERARQAGRFTWRDIRLMARLVEKVQTALIQTMPPGRDQYYAGYAEHGHYELMINGPIRNKRLVLIHDRHLAAICEAAMTNECIMCIREGNEIERCPLRQGLLEVAPPREVQEGRWRRCEYRRAAGQLVNDEELEI